MYQKRSQVLEFLDIVTKEENQKNKQVMENNDKDETNHNQNGYRNNHKNKQFDEYDDHLFN